MPSGKSLNVVQRESFFDDAFFKEAWEDFDRAVQSVLDKFDNSGLKVDQGSRSQCRDVYSKIRTSNIDQDLYASQALQITEKDGKFQAVMDVKDFNPRELQVRAVDDRIVVEGSYQKVSEDGSSSSHKSFYKEFALPPAADIDQVSTALSKDGVLTIKAPKKDGAAITEGPKTSSSSSSSSTSSVQQSSFSDGGSSSSFKSSSSKTVIQSSSSFESSSTDGLEGLPKAMREKLMFSDSGFGSAKTSTCSSPAPSEAGSESSRVSSTMEFDIGKKAPMRSEVAFNVTSPSQPTPPPIFQQTPQPTYQQPPHPSQYPQGQFQQPLQSQFQQSPQPQYQQPPQPQCQQPPQPQYQQPPQPQYQQPLQSHFQQPPQSKFQQPSQPQFQQPAQPQFQQAPQTQFQQSPQPQFQQSPQGQFHQPPQSQSQNPHLFQQPLQSQQPPQFMPQQMFQQFPQSTAQPDLQSMSKTAPQVPLVPLQPIGKGNQTTVNVSEENGRRVLTSQTSSVVQEKDGFMEHRETAAEIADKDSQAARREATTKMAHQEEDPEGKFKRSEAADAAEVSESCVQHMPDGSVMSVKKSSTSSSSMKQSFSSSTGDAGPFFQAPNFPTGFGDLRNLMDRGHSLMSQMSTDSMASTLSGRSGFSDMSNFSQFSDTSSQYSGMSNFSNMSNFSDMSSRSQTQNAANTGNMPQDLNSPRVVKSFSSSSTSSFNKSSFSSNFGDRNF